MKAPELYRYRRSVGPRKPVLTPIPGSELRLGDRVWIDPAQVMTVESITFGCAGPTPRPQLVARGPAKYDDFDFFTRGHYPFHVHDWVVVER
jgi:hypothetical protein